MTKFFSANFPATLRWLEPENLIGDLGIDESSYVVVVPAGVNVFDFGSAAHTYWTLKYTGVANVSILDGGLAAWKAAGYKLAPGAQRPSPAIFTASIDNSIRAVAADVAKPNSATPPRGGASSRAGRRAASLTAQS